MIKLIASDLDGTLLKEGTMDINPDRSCALFHKFTFLFYLIQYAGRYNPVTFRTRIINRFMTVRRIEISARFIRVTPEVIFTIGTCTGPCAQIPVGFCILYIIGIKQCTGIFYRESDVGGFGRYISTHGSRPADRRRTSPLEVNTVLDATNYRENHVATVSSAHNKMPPLSVGA